MTDLDRDRIETREHIRSKAIDYLSRRDYSREKLIRKICDLKRRYPNTRRYDGYVFSEVSEVISEMESEGLVNDRRYALRLLEQLKDKKEGMARIQAKMYRRLINKEVIREVIQQFVREGKPQDFSQIQKESQKKYLRLLEKYGSTQQGKMKAMSGVYAYLARKGFLPDDIQHIIKKVGLEEFTENQ